MRKWFSWVPTLLSNTKVSITLEGWPATAAVACVCATGFGTFYLLIKEGILQRLALEEDD